MFAGIPVSSIIDLIKPIFTLSGFLYWIDVFRKRSRIRVCILEEVLLRQTGSRDSD